MTEKQAFDLGYAHGLSAAPERYFLGAALREAYQYGYWNGQNTKSEYDNSDVND